MIAFSLLIALLSAWLIHPKIVAVAKLKGITDDPNVRKLQRKPIPVLGGIVVFFGIMMGLAFTTFFITYNDFVLYLAIMFLLLSTGSLDDVTNLSPGIRFLIEIVATLVLVFIGKIMINDFHGLWGLHQVGLAVSVILTIITVVGIINAINLIDGVDGLSSGYCILVCGFFAGYFYTAGDVAMTALALSSMGALIPFFFYNVFGKKGKMFIGDGGTLLMGMVISICVMRMIGSNTSSPVFDLPGVSSLNGRPTHFGIVPLSLAILSCPICDTLRVMISRILRRQSPFIPDKTHLHHALIGIGFSHIKTTISILALNVFILALWILLYIMGCSIDCQFYAVVGTTIVLNLTIFYCCKKKQSIS